ncbi:hypothetical protein [Prochlorococcus marinus]|uniref:hypothetical protein n=1 Tax=Prochlorococcus marinus TaxID=1219 RepID=UPI001F1F1931|nr:hypothetical protein [Prochlorococcus marinus]
MPFRKVPNYITKARQSYVLQRAVPRDLRSVIGIITLQESPSQRKKTAQSPTTANT